MTISDAQARRIAERHYPNPREGSLPWLFIETGAIPYVPHQLLEDLAIQDQDDRLALLGYVEANGPRPSLAGWDRITSGGQYFPRPG